MAASDLTEPERWILERLDSIERDNQDRYSDGVSREDVEWLIEMLRELLKRVKKAIVNRDLLVLRGDPNARL
jgi:hypothetical protein